MNSEPLLTVSGLTALVTAGLGVLVAFGVTLTPDQQTALLGLAAVAAPLLVGVVARRYVSPTAGDHEA